MDRLHGDGVTRVDVGDAGREDDLLRLRRQKTDEREGVASNGFGGPEGAVALGFDGLGEGGGFGRGHAVEACPDAEFSGMLKWFVHDPARYQGAVRIRWHS